MKTQKKSYPTAFKYLENVIINPPSIIVVESQRTKTLPEELRCWPNFKKGVQVNCGYLHPCLDVLDFQGCQSKAPQRRWLNVR